MSCLTSNFHQCKSNPVSVYCRHSRKNKQWVGGKRNSLSFGNCTFTLKMFSFELVFPFPIGIDQLCFLLWSQCKSSKNYCWPAKIDIKVIIILFIFISSLSEIFMTVVTALFMVACHSRYQNIQLTQSHKKFGGSKIYCSTQKNNGVLSGCHKKKKII